MSVVVMVAWHLFSDYMASDEFYAFFIKCM